MNKINRADATNTGTEKIKHFNFTTTYRDIKASIVSVMMWLSFIGGLL